MSLGPHGFYWLIGGHGNDRERLEKPDDRVADLRRGKVLAEAPSWPAVEGKESGLNIAGIVRQPSLWSKLSSILAKYVTLPGCDVLGEDDNFASSYQHWALAIRPAADR